MPTNEQTDQSDVSQVQSGVIDPVRVIEQLITAKGCPAAMRLYDGRRVVALTPSATEQSGDTLSCTLSYTVVAGPGHLSPLRISSAKMHLSYSVTALRQSLRQIKISSGIFSVRLNRAN